MMKIARTAGCVLVVTLVATPPSWAHPGHETFAEVVWNDTSRSLEVALRIPTMDVESALARAAEKRLDLVRSKHLESRLQRYVQRHFLLHNAAGKRLKPQFAGQEVGPREVWIYFEFAAGESTSLTSCRIENTLLLGEHEDQSNFVEFRQGRSVRMLRFDSLQTSQTIDLRGSQQPVGWVMERKEVKERSDTDPPSRTREGSPIMKAASGPCRRAPTTQQVWTYAVMRTGTHRMRTRLRTGTGTKSRQRPCGCCALLEPVPFRLASAGQRVWTYRRRALVGSRRRSLTSRFPTSGLCRR